MLFLGLLNHFNYGYYSAIKSKFCYFANVSTLRSRPDFPVAQCRQLSRKIKVLLDFFQKIVGFQRATPLVAFRRKRNPYALRAFLLLFAIEKEAEFEAEPHKLPQQFA